MEIADRDVGKGNCSEDGGTGSGTSVATAGTAPTGHSRADAGSGVRKWRRGDIHPDSGLVFWDKINGKQRWIPQSSAIKWRETANKVSRSWARINKSKSCAIKKKWSDKNPDNARERGRAYAARHKERRKIQRKKSDAKHLKIRMERKVAYDVARRKRDKAFRLKHNIGSRIRLFLKTRSKSKTCGTAKILGCDSFALITHIESLFQVGMTWENYGTIKLLGNNCWHLDHRIPLASAKTDDEIIALCHYTNLRPMWALDNMAKGNLMPEEYEARLKLRAI